MSSRNESTDNTDIATALASNTLRETEFVPKNTSSTTTNRVEGETRKKYRKSKAENVIEGTEMTEKKPIRKEFD